MANINFNFPYVADPDKGKPLDFCQLFVGEPDLDPAVPANQKQLNIVQEDGTLVPTSQPFTFSAGGVPTFNGSTVRLDVDGNYSFKILDKKDVLKYYVHNVFEGEPVTETTFPILLGDQLPALLEQEISQAYEFATVAAYKAFATAFPVGKIIHLLDRKADFIVITGTGTANTFNIISSDQVSQSIDLIIKESVNLNQMGAVGDGVADDTLVVQASLDLSNGSLKGLVTGEAGFHYKWSSITIPSGITFSLTGCEVTVTTFNAVRMQDRSKFYGFGTRLSGDQPSTQPYIIADDASTVTQECEVLGFEMFDVNVAKNATAVNLSSFYQSKFDFTCFGFKWQYQQAGSVQCYYNSIVISCTETSRGILTQGTLFNANEIVFKRCNVDAYGGRFESATGNTMNIQWIEGVGSAFQGLYFIASNKNTIVGGVIEGVAGAKVGIEFATTSEDNCVINTEFGGEFANSGKKIIASSGVTGTTILNADETFFGFDGTITNIGGGSGNRVNVGSILATEATRLAEFTVGTLPTAVGFENGMIIVTDEVGGRTPAFSDGSNWRRCTDLTIVSV